MSPIAQQSAVLAACLAAATLAACSDAPTAPGAATSAAAVAEPSAARGPAIKMMNLKVRIAQKVNPALLIGGMRVTFKRGADSVMVWDNKEGDLDANYGFVSARLPFASGAQYSARVSGGDPNFYREEAVVTGMALLGTNLNFPDILMRRSPVITLKAINGLTQLPVAGTSFFVTGPTGPYMLFTDNPVLGAGYDLDPAVGTLRYPFTDLGVYTFCEQGIPTGFQQRTPTCFEVNAPEPDKTYTRELAYRPL